jgi:hypothetical protein
MIDKFCQDKMVLAVVKFGHGPKKLMGKKEKLFFVLIITQKTQNLYLNIND